MNCPACGQENPVTAKFCNECGAGLETLENTVAPLPLTSRSFIGRQREMAELFAALEDARAGRGRLVMLVGEPGIGKTRTSQELAAHAESSGCIVLWGRCYAEGGTPPYWPWVLALNAYIGLTSLEQLREEMGAGASAIAEIIPEIRDKFPNLASSPFQEPDQARFLLFSSISTFLKNIARSQPLLLVLDDLHWADRSTLLLLEFLAREIPTTPLFLLGTYRDVEVSRRHPLSETLGSLMREQSFLRLQLTGLAQPEVELLLRNSVDGVPESAPLSAVHQRTEGNPLFVGEIARMLIREGAGERLALPAGIPEGIRDAIGRRLNRLSESCNQVLTIASVIGREFELRHLEPLVENMSEDGLLEILEEALSARVIEELPLTVGRYQFAHALIEETLTDEITLTRRVRLHARIAETLEELYGANVEAHASELAKHFAAAEAALGSDKVIRFSWLAGERALETYAWEDALLHFQRALSSKEGRPMDGETAAICFGLGRAQVATYLTGQHQEFLSNLERAFDYYLDAGEVASAVAVAECHLPAIFGRLEGAAERVLTALKLVSPDSLEAGRLLSQYIRLRGAEKDGYAGAKTALDQVLGIAQRQSDQALELRARAAFAPIAQFHPQFGEGLEQSLKAIELAQQVNDPHSEIYARMSASHFYLFAGKPEEAQRHGSAALAAADRLGDRFWRNGSQYRLLTLALALGDWAAAREIGNRGLLLDETDRRMLGGLARLEYELGDFNQGAAYLNRILGVQLSPEPSYFGNSVVGLLMPMAYRITGKVFRLDHAEAAIDAVISSDYVIPRFEALARSGLNQS